MKKSWLSVCIVIAFVSCPYAMAVSPVARTSARAVAAARSQVFAQRSPAGTMTNQASAGHTRDIEKALEVDGQARNLAMDLLFQKDKDKVSFGTPRTNYKDKISEKRINF